MSEGNNQPLPVPAPQSKGVFSFSLSMEGIAVAVVAAVLIVIGTMQGMTLHRHESRITALERVVTEIVAPSLHKHWWQK